MKKTFVVNNNIDEISRIEQFVENVGDELGLDGKLRYNLNLILEEAVTNIIFYGLKDKNDGKIEINLEYENGEIHVDIVDCGIPFNPLEEETDPHKVLEEDTKIGGLGILIIRKLSKELKYKYEDGKNHFSIII